MIWSLQPLVSSTPYIPLTSLLGYPPLLLSINTKSLGTIVTFSVDLLHALGQIPETFHLSPAQNVLGLCI